MTELEYIVSTGLYIDVENLQAEAQELIVNLLQDWSPAKPRPTRVVLYVRADMVELWTMWAHTNIRASVMEVKGIQHFTAQQSKNSADIAMAVDAMVDLLSGMVHHVTVFSDDSDFISLFAKIRTETKGIQSEIGRIPFLWVLTNRDGTKTPNIQQFFPTEYLHIVRANHQVSLQRASATSEQPQVPNNQTKTKSQDELVSEAIMQEVPVGEFKSVDCQEIVKRWFPNHPRANQGGASFGEYISKNIWPSLEAHGVELIGTNPRKYKMTQAAKDYVELMPLTSKTPGQAGRALPSSTVLAHRILIQPPRADPAHLRNVNHLAVGAFVLGLHVLVAGAGLAGVQRLVDRGHLAGTGGGQPRLDFLQALDLEPDVMDALPVLAALAGHVVILEVRIAMLTLPSLSMNPLAFSPSSAATWRSPNTSE